MKSSYPFHIPFNRMMHFNEAAENLLLMMSHFLPLNTLFIARNDAKDNEIIHSLNKGEELLKEGDVFPFHETFCKVCIENGQDVLIISDIAQNKATQELPFTLRYGRGSFIGIPINYKDGENYGTVCGFDTETFHFEPSHTALFQSIASQLSYVLELERAQQQVENLLVPFVPIKKGVAILPVVGILNETLFQNMVDLTLEKCHSLHLDYLIVDLSGVAKINQIVVDWMIDLVDLLKLMGVIPIITGITPEFAMKSILHKEPFQNVRVESNLERGLKQIGLNIEITNE